MRKARVTKPIAERLWAKVQKTDACWLWTGARIKSNSRLSPYGYGTICLGTRPNGKGLAHRVAWTLVVGPIPKGLLVLHKCDNPPCVNPDHLFLGTQKDNVEDCAKKGRRNQARHGRHRGKLSDEQRHQIPSLREQGLTQESIAEMFGVRAQTIAYWERELAAWTP